MIYYLAVSRVQLEVLTAALGREDFQDDGLHEMFIRLLEIDDTDLCNRQLPIHDPDFAP